jgi:hypothetical protein
MPETDNILMKVAARLPERSNFPDMNLHRSSTFTTAVTSIRRLT